MGGQTEVEDSLKPLGVASPPAPYPAARTPPSTSDSAEDEGREEVGAAVSTQTSVAAASGKQHEHHRTVRLQEKQGQTSPVVATPSRSPIDEPAKMLPGAFRMVGDERASIEEEEEEEEAEYSNDNVNAFIDDPQPILEAHLVEDEKPHSKRESNDPHCQPHQNLTVEDVIMDEDEVATKDPEAPMMVEASLLQPKTPTFWRNRRLLFCAAILVVVTVSATLGIVLAIQNNRDNSNPETLAPQVPVETVGSTKESFVQDVLPDYTKAALEDPLSDQSLALEWLWRDPNMTASLPLFRRVQRYAMAVNFLSTTGLRSPEDIQRTEWMTDLHECTWPQNFAVLVVCQDERLLMMDWSMKSEIQGTIPPEVALLTHLSLYAMSETNLKGTIPTHFGLLSNELEQILLNQANLSGPIPSEIGNLEALLELNVADNMLTSTLPTDLGRLSLVRALYVDGNKLQGSIPTEVGQLSQELLWLSVHATFVTGTLPSEIGLLTALEGLQISTTNMTGPIPTEMGNLVSACELSMDNTHLNGTIPTQLQQMTRLSSLTLHDTELVGTFPLCYLVEQGRLTTYTVPCDQVQCSCDCTCQR